jgi:fibronectin type 3 domain-containing protein
MYDEAQDLTAPASPTGLTAVSQEPAIGLSWSANSEPDLSFYSVYRNTIDDSLAAGLVDVVSKPTTDYTDNDVVSWQTYYYWISATDSSDNESGLSAGASAIPDVTAPAKPTGLTAAGGNKQVQLDWTANAEADLSHYRVWRDTDFDPADNLWLDDPQSNTYLERSRTVLSTGTGSVPWIRRVMKVHCQPQSSARPWRRRIWLRYTFQAAAGRGPGTRIPWIPLMRIRLSIKSPATR